MSDAIHVENVTKDNTGYKSIEIVRGRAIHLLLERSDSQALQTSDTVHANQTLHIIRRKTKA